MFNVIIASSKEEKEKLLNIRIEEIKKKNEELLSKHKLIEEDKRQAELQGRTIQNNKLLINENNEINNKGKSIPTKKGRSGDTKPQQQVNVVPMEPTYNFLFDKMRVGSNEQEDCKEKTRRHPRNYGGINFEDVPKKIQQERARQNNHRHHYKSGEIDYTLVTTGKERREMDEWRREREEIDRRRMQRQRKEDGGWKREWDRNKESPVAESNHSSNAKSSFSEQGCFPKLWANNGSSGYQRHYNKIYHQKKKLKRNFSDLDCAAQENNGSTHGSSTHQLISQRESPQNMIEHPSSPKLSDDFNRRNRRQSRNDSWRSWKSNVDQNGKWRKNDSVEALEIPKTTPREENKITPESKQSSSSSSSSRKSVRFLDHAVERNDEQLLDDQQQQAFARQGIGRNFIGSGRFSGGQKFRPRGHRFRRDFMKSPDHQSYQGRYGNQIKKVYIDEAMCGTVEVVINPGKDYSSNHVEQERKASPVVEKSVGSDELEKKSDEDDYHGDNDDEDEQWEDIDEEICLELDHGRDETNASSESLDQFIINNTLVLDAPEILSSDMRTPQSGQPDVSEDSSMGPRGGYPNVLDWEDDAESISHLSDMEKCNTSESSVESNISAIIPLEVVGANGEDIHDDDDDDYDESVKTEIEASREYFEEIDEKASVLVDCLNNLQFTVNGDEDNCDAQVMATSEDLKDVLTFNETTGDKDSNDDETTGDNDNNFVETTGDKDNNFVEASGDKDNNDDETTGDDNNNDEGDETADVSKVDNLHD